MTSEQLATYIQNTGEMYKGNCALARENVPIDRWYWQARKGLFLWRRDMHEPNEGLSELELQETARQIKAYYEQHVKEGA